MSGLIWVHTFCKGYQQTGKEVSQPVASESKLAWTWKAGPQIECVTENTKILNRTASMRRFLRRKNAKLALWESAANKAIYIFVSRKYKNMLQNNVVCCDCERHLRQNQNKEKIPVRLIILSDHIWLFFAWTSYDMPSFFQNFAYLLK